MRQMNAKEVRPPAQGPTTGKRQSRNARVAGGLRRSLCLHRPPECRLCGLCLPEVLLYDRRKGPKEGDQGARQEEQLV